ncbi:MAG: leucine-rich repeat protein [Oscillospiraceae bacterium]|jgi:hypothetical protein|nr:leucine-rich repeat protein [Oscillospiraceae bacterium]
MIEFLQKVLAQFLAALMALFGLSAGQGSLLPPGADVVPLAQSESAALWAAAELATLAVDWAADDVAAPAAPGKLTPQSLPASGGNFGFQLYEGRAISIYETLEGVTTAGFDAASLPAASPNYVPYVVNLSPGDYLVYSRAIAGSNGSSPNSTDLAEIGKLLQPQVQAALEAFGRDYPEVFWLAYGEGGTTFVPDGAAQVNGTTLTITIQSVELRLRTKTAYAGRVSASAALLAQEVALLTPPPAAGVTRQEAVRGFHDAIIARVGSRIEYFSDRADDATGPLLRQFAGGDVAPFGSATGFAKAFKLLCDSAGIPCVIISGMRSYPTEMPHTWNEVQMENGLWYAVDVLLDDGYSVAGELTYFEYLLAGGNTVDFSFGGERFNDSHFQASGYSGYFTNNKYFMFSYPPLSPVRYTAGLELAPLENALELALPYPAYCYTAASVSAFEAAKQAGLALLSDPTLSQADQEAVDNAAVAIVVAFSALAPLPVLRARANAQATVSFAYHQITLSRTGVTPAVLLAEEVESGIAGAQLSVTPAAPAFTYVGTGAKVTVQWTADGQPCAQVYTVLLLGDTNGDGLVNSEDAQSVSGIFTFSEGGGIATITDVDETRASGVVTLPEYTPGGSLVVGVAPEAFLFCNDITQLILSDSITGLGTRCFYFMDGLEKLTLGAGVTELPEDMCFMNTHLREVVFRGDVVTIGRRAFGECPVLQSVVLPASVQSIGREAFVGCVRLQSVILVDGLQSIGVNAFQRCTLLGDIVVPNSVTEIGRGAFSNCPEVVLVCGFQSAAYQFARQYTVNYRLILVLQELRILKQPNKLIYFTGDAFNPQGMEVRAIYDNGGEVVLSAASYQVEGFSTEQPGQLTVTLRYQGKTVSLQIRVYDFQYSLIEGNSEVMVTGYVGRTADAVIPAEIEGKPVTMVGAATFSVRSDVTTIAFAPSVASIQTGAFDGATGLQAFEVAQGNAAFSAGGGLLYDAAGTRLIAYPTGRSAAAVTLPPQVTSVAPHAFAGCAALEQLSTGVNAAAWVAGAIFDCPNLTLLVYPLTTAHFYAQQDAIPFQLVSTAEELRITPPAKQHYIVREPLDTEGLLVQLRYADGAVYTVPSGFTLSAFNSSTSGTKTITVTFQGFSGTFEVTVAETDNRVYRYTVLPDGTAKLTRYLGTGGDLAAPASIDGYTVSTLGQSLYDGVTSINSLILPNTVTTIESRVFAGCTHMTHITLPEGLLSIGDEAFSRCTALASVALPGTLDSVGAYAFADCTGLQNLVLPEALAYAGSYAFSGCTALQTVSIGSALAELGNYAFTGCTALQNVQVAAANQAYSDNGGILLNKAGDTLLRYPQGRSDSSYTVPPEITSIGLGAFSGAQLSSLYIYRTVSSIASTAMSGASAALLLYCYRNSAAHVFAQQYGVMFQLLPNPQPTGIALAAPPAQLAYYAGDALDLTGMVVRVDYPDGTSEELRSGYTVTGFDSSPLPEGVSTRTCTVTVAYMGCTASFTVTVEDVAGTEFTYSRNAQEELTITGYTGSSAVLRIPAMAKAPGQSSPHAVIAIGAGAFEGCQTITKVIIPPTIRSIGANAFRNCASLAEATLPANLTALPNELFKGCTALASVALPTALLTLGEEAFSGSGIKYLPLPEGLQTIAAMAFYNMPELKHLSLPASVASIGTSAFGSCPALQTVFFGNAAPTMAFGAFGSGSNARGIAPAGGAVAAYLESAGQLSVLYTVSGDWAYGNWSGMTGARIAAYLGADPQVELPETLGGVSIVGVMPHAFFNNQALQSVSVPASYIALGAGAFALCAGLERITVYNSKTSFSFGDMEVFYGAPLVTLEGFEGSRVQSYATQNNLPFLPLRVEYFHFVDGVNPFQVQGETAERHRMISGFTADYDTPDKARAAFELAEGETLVFCKVDGVTALGENARIGSGTQIQLWDAYGQLADVLVAVYFGDANGDGLSDARDAAILQAYLAGMVTQAALHPAMFLALDANRDGLLNETDFVWMADSGLGSRKIPQETTW